MRRKGQGLWEQSQGSRVPSPSAIHPGQVPYFPCTSVSSSVKGSSFYLTQGTIVRCDVMTYKEASSIVQSMGSVLDLFPFGC